MIISHLLEAIIASAFFFLKLWLVFALAKLIRKSWALDHISGLISGWLLLLAFQHSIILALSAAGLMSQPYFLTLMLAASLLLHWKSRSVPFSPWIEDKSAWNLLPLIAILFVLLAMWLRSIFFFDYTWDALTYGIPRLVMWLNYGSVFISMPTPQLNLFVNEWNAELNALGYALASGGYTGFAFGNLEILLLLFLTVVWVAVLLGARMFWALCLAAVIGSAPAVLGLATTTKGDLLACTAFLASLGWLIHIKQRGPSTAFAYGMLLLALTLAVGSKVSVALSALTMGVLALALIDRRGVREILQLPALTKLAILAGLAAFSARLLTNWVVYENPLKRMHHEKAQFSLNHLFENLAQTWERLFSFGDIFPNDERSWALMANMGGAAWLILITALMASAAWMVLRNRALRQNPQPGNGLSDAHLDDRNSTTSDLDRLKPDLKWLMFVCACLAMATVAGMTLSAAAPWAFRYHAPGIITLLIVIGAVSIPVGLRGNWRAALVLASLIVVAINLAITSRPGEIVPAPLGDLTAKIKIADSAQKRIHLYVRDPYKSAAVDRAGLDVAQPLNILVFHTPDTALAPFVGSRAQNRIRTVADENELLAISSLPGWDIVAVLLKKEMRNQQTVHALKQQGYFVVADNAKYLIVKGGTGNLGPLVPRGSVLQASASTKAMSSYLKSGWSSEEDWGVWSDGPLAAIEFSVRGALDRDLRITLITQTFLPQLDSSMTVVPVINDKAHPVWMYRSGEPMPTRQTLVMSGQDLTTAEGRVRLELRISDPKSPQELGLSQDSRKLGVGLIGMEVH